MPDLFLDRLLTFEGDLEQLSKVFADIAERRGGEVIGVKQTELRGGNASNAAVALATLGAKVYPIIQTSPLGLHLLRFYLEPLRIDLSHVKTNGTIALTTALEFLHAGERVNAMLSDLGSLPEFRFSDLTARDLRLIEQADYVGVFNWTETVRWGTELAEGVFRNVKEKGKGITYFDTSDPTSKKKDIPRLLNRVLRTRFIDILSVNENEAFHYASQINRKVNRLKKTSKPADLAKECARILAQNLSARVDLHTSTFSGSFTNKDEILVPTFNVKVLRTTGAGDAWNAGNIIGDALSLPSTCRLTLANAVAAYYISSPTGEHPTLPKLIEFCSKQQS
jgi:sugar/nucleoside kinase (ribokinase family)